MKPISFTKKISNIVEDLSLKTNMDKETYQNFITYINVVAKYTTVVAFLFYLYYQLANMIIGISKIVDISKDDNGIINTITNRIDSISSSFRTFVRQLI